MGYLTGNGLTKVDLNQNYLWKFNNNQKSAAGNAALNYKINENETLNWLKWHCIKTSQINYDSRSFLFVNANLMYNIMMSYNIAEYQSSQPIIFLWFLHNLYSLWSFNYWLATVCNTYFGRKENAPYEFNKATLKSTVKGGILIY